MLPPHFPGIMSGKHPWIQRQVYLFISVLSDLLQDHPALAMASASLPLLMIIEILWGRAPNLT